jgi:hypothetical protein
MNSSVLDSSAYLFTPRSSYRFRPATVPFSQPDDPTAGQNPPYGASINYYLKSAPKGDVKLRIEDAKGHTVRTLTGTKTAGVNRTNWDLRYELSKEIRLRTSPAYAPEIHVGPEGWRPLPEGGRMSVLAPPGTYTVKLSVDGRDLSRTLTVIKDPNSGGSEQESQAQTEMLLDLRHELESAADMVNQIETIRSQLAGITSMLQSNPENASIKSAADDLDKKLIDVEDNLIQRRLTGAGQDTTRWPAKLISKINYLAGGLASADFGPTTQQREVAAQLKEQLTAVHKRLDEVVNRDVEAFNKLLRDKNISGIITKGP